MRVIVFLACLLALAFSARHPLPSGSRLIVGGEESPKRSRPYQVALFNDASGGFNHQYCGGTLVHPEWVVSAAHCAGGAVYAGLGFHDLNDQGKQIIRGTWFPHPDYNSGTHDNDAALIKLYSPATLTDGVRTISIAKRGSDVSQGENLLISGWGSLSSGGYYPTKLRQAVIKGVDRGQCRSAYGYYHITDNMICAASEGKDSCQGDSGGPLVSHFNKDEDVPGVILEGIVSWGIGCAFPGYPGVYVHASKYCEWFKSVTSGAVTC